MRAAANVILRAEVLLGCVGEMPCFGVAGITCVCAGPLARSCTPGKERFQLRELLSNVVLVFHVPHRRCR